MSDVKLYLVPGHGAGDSGAVGNGWREDEQVRRLAARMVELGGGQVAMSDPERNCYYEDGMLSWYIPEGAQVLSMHRDSADCYARGGHVIIKSGIGGADAYDEALADAVAAIFPGRADRIREVSWLKNANQAASRGIPYRLVELGFISDPQDCEVFEGRFEELARAILAAFGVLPAQSVEPSPEPEPEAPAGSYTEEFHGGTYRCRVDSLNVRTGPGLGYAAVAAYTRGLTVVLDDWYCVKDGFVWGRYTGACSGELRYVAVGPHTGAPDASDYLVKI